MNNFDQIEQLHPSKKELKALAKDEANNYLESGKDVMPDYVKAKRIIDYCTEWCNNVKTRVVDEREAYTKNEDVRIYSATVSVMEGGVRYDYKKCNDPEWEALNERVSNLQKQLKDRENYLKSLTKTETILNEESGEVYKIFPPKRTSTTTPKVDY